MGLSQNELTTDQIDVVNTFDKNETEEKADDGEYVA